MTTLTQGDITITPDLVEGYEATSASRTLVHTIPGRAEPIVIGRPSSTRAGTLPLLFKSETAALEAAASLRAGGLWTLISDEQPTINMQFAVAGDVTLKVDDIRTVWHVGVGFQEVSDTGSSDGGTSGSRFTVTYTTESLADEAQETGLVPMAATYRVLSVTTDEGARVRLYDTTAHRTADLARERGDDPAEGAGVMLDVALEEAGTLTLSPIVTGAVLEPGGGAWVPITVDNLSGGTTPVAVTFLYERA